ncbi:hypothetical protein ACHAXS_007392 [Conticribra weissflogii]
MYDPPPNDRNNSKQDKNDPNREILVHDDAANRRTQDPTVATTPLGSLQNVATSVRTSAGHVLPGNDANVNVNPLDILNFGEKNMAGDDLSPMRRNRNSHGSTWQWNNMFAVAEEDEEETEEENALADFGLHQLGPPVNASATVSSIKNVRNAVGNDGGYHAPLLLNDYQQDISSSSNILNESQTRQKQQRHFFMNENSIKEEKNNNIGYVLLQKLHLLPKNEGWAAVSDLDVFFTSLYNYYYHRGIGSILGQGIVELVSLFFTLWLSLVLFAYIDWRGLLKCNDEESCHDNFFEGYVNRGPFSWSGGNYNGSGGKESDLDSEDDHYATKNSSTSNNNNGTGGNSFLVQSWIIIYCLLFTSYGILSMMQFVSSFLSSIEAKLFMQEVLGISDRDLQVGTVEWSDIVEKMSEAQNSGRCRIAVFPAAAAGVAVGSSYRRHINSTNNPSDSNAHSQNDDQCNSNAEEGPTSHLVVAQRIMRRENFLIAFFNRGMLDLTFPSLPSWLWPFSIITNKPRSEKMVFYSKSIEWSIYFCVLNYMFNHSRKIRPAFYGDPSSLRRRFVLCGVAHAVFMPFLLFFVTLHFFMLNLYDWQSTKEYLGPREWSSVARWTFREFNELPHLFERRME